MSLRRLFPLLLSLALAVPAAGQEQVARVKSAPQDYRGRAIELQGEAVEVQALSPRSRQGVYRLVDATEAAPYGCYSPVVSDELKPSPLRLTVPCSAVKPS